MDAGFLCKKAVMLSVVVNSLHFRLPLEVMWLMYFSSDLSMKSVFLSSFGELSVFPYFHSLVTRFTSQSASLAVVTV